MKSHILLGSTKCHSERSAVRHVVEESRALLMAMVAVFLLASCGEDVADVTNINQMGMEVVSKVSELPKCTKDNEGEQAFVKGETSPRVCVDGKWFATAGGKDTVLVKDSILVKDTVVVKQNSSCTTKELADKSGVKIICGGDSVGVVLNGKNGANGKDGKDGANGKDGATGAAGKDGSGCTVETLANNTGLKVLCGGDSVGVVLNGKNGADGKDGVNGKDGTNGKDGAKGDKGDMGATGAAGDGCELSQKGTEVTIKCGDKSTVIDVGSGSGVIVVDTATLDSEKIAVSLNEISGVTQKGPFLMGSKVLVREMENGRTLTQTGNSFNGKILNDKGEFKINARMLVSQYAMLETSGYYRNEVTGKNSNSELTLFAITDLNQRNVVNVNLLTHLEYERVVYLVTQKKMKVKDAKKQAQKEIFDLLDIDATGFSNSEDLNIAGASNEDGALLAFSILFQGYRTESQLTELLTKIAIDMEEDGSWDDFKTKMEIAEWAADVDSAGGLEKIRNNVKAWGLSSIVPNFEQHVRHFWNTEYGLGDCTADSIGRVKAATAGKRKNTKTRFICEDAVVLWRVATDLEKDRYNWNPDNNKNGELLNGPISGRNLVWDADTLRHANGMENSLNKGCVSYIQNSNVMFDHLLVTDSTKYYCSDKGWVQLKGWDWNVPREALLNPEINYGTMVDPRDRKVYKTVTIGEQTWMAQNLNYADSAKTLSLKGESWCYGNVDTHCDVAGRLYTWAAAIDSVALATDTIKPQKCGYGVTCSLPAKVQGICPKGWHLPSREEWETLIDVASPYAGWKLKSLSGWHSESGKFYGGADSLGFSALPVGAWYINETFGNIGMFAYFWSSSEADKIHSYYIYANSYEDPKRSDFHVGYTNNTSLYEDNTKNNGFSIRCIQDSKE